MRTWTVGEVAAQLSALGVRRGGVLLVHTSFKAVRPIDGGPLGLLRALRAVLGDDGTLVMPTMTDGESPDSPPGRVHELDGRVLLLGVRHS